MRKNYDQRMLHYSGAFSRFLTQNKQLLLIAATVIGTALAGCKKEQSIPATPVGADDVAATSNLTTFATPPIPTKSEALLAMQVFNNKFYNQYGTYGSSFKAYYWLNDAKNERMDFWKQQEAIETLIDAYEINPSTDLKNQIIYLYNGVRDRDGLLWTLNSFNDDVMWGVLMCLRAYKITNDGGMLSMAQNNFDMVWLRGWDTKLGGGLWWTTARASKNSCLNAPAVICAMKLYDATGNVAYKNKAKLIMDWMVSKLYIASTGEVKGAIRKKEGSGADTLDVYEGWRTYTQGTFIGAADVLRTPYPAVNYLAMGSKAMDFARSNMNEPSSTILVNEDDILDNQGFKGIFARWACRFVKNTGTRSNYGAWLDNNAAQAWSIRNNSGLMWNKWLIRTAETGINAFQTTTGVSMVNNIYIYR